MLGNRASSFRLPVQCIFLKLNGSWPLDASSNKQPAKWIVWMYAVWAWYVIISVGITIGFQSAFLFSNLNNIAMTTENCCTTFMGALNFIRLFHMRVNQRKFRSIIEKFEKTIWIKKGSHPQIEEKCHQNMKTFRIMTALLACLILMYCVLPLVELYLMSSKEEHLEEKPFPYKMLFPYDAHHGWRYVLTYAFTSTCGVCVVTTLFAEDSLFGFFITYTCAQFEILHERIDAVLETSFYSTLKRVTESDIPKEDLQREYTHQLNRIAFRHNHLIKFGKVLEDFFNPMMLVNFMISSILICMVGFQLVTGNDMFVGDYIKFLVYISSALSQLFILCWNGDKLIQTSLDTANHLYGCRWEVYSTRDTKPLIKHQMHPTGKDFRINLQFMIMCSQRPVKLTALKFSTLSLQSFTAILSSSMSYFTLLQSVYKNNGNT